MSTSRASSKASPPAAAAKPYSDFRKLLDNRDLQAVVVCTPDHWHALMTMMACAAGKDVYVEKPLTLFVSEGRWMTDVARRHNRIVQVGTQQRSGTHYQRARELLQSGYIGKIMSVAPPSYRNVMPGFGSPPDTAAPPDFDYDMWLGPAPERPYNPQPRHLPLPLVLGLFRRPDDQPRRPRNRYHAVGHARQRPVRGLLHSADASSFRKPAKPPTPRTLSSNIPGFTAAYSFREASAGRRAGTGLEFFGMKGSMVVTRAGFEVFPDQKADPANSIPVFQGHPAGGRSAPRQTRSRGSPP